MDRLPSFENGVRESHIPAQIVSITAAIYNTAGEESGPGEQKENPSNVCDFLENKCLR